MEAGEGCDSLPSQVLLRSRGLRGGRWTPEEHLGMCLSVVVVGIAIQVSCGHWGMQDVLVVASFLASRSCEVCVCTDINISVVITIIFFFFFSLID